MNKTPKRYLQIYGKPNCVSEEAHGATGRSSTCYRGARETERRGAQFHGDGQPSQTTGQACHPGF